MRQVQGSIVTLNVTGGPRAFEFFAPRRNESSALRLFAQMVIICVLVAIAKPCSISEKDWFLFYRSTSKPPFTSMQPIGLDGLISELVPGKGVKLCYLGKSEGNKGERKKEQRESREKAERKW